MEILEALYLGEDLTPFVQSANGEYSIPKITEAEYKSWIYSKRHELNFRDLRFISFRDAIRKAKKYLMEIFMEKSMEKSIKTIFNGKFTVDEDFTFFALRLTSEDVDLFQEYLTVTFKLDMDKLYVHRVATNLQTEYYNKGYGLEEVQKQLEDIEVAMKLMHKDGALTQFLSRTPFLHGYILKLQAVLKWLYSTKEMTQNLGEFWNNLREIYLAEMEVDLAKGDSLSFDVDVILGKTPQEVRVVFSDMSKTGKTLKYETELQWMDYETREVRKSVVTKKIRMAKFNEIVKKLVL